MEKGLEAGYIKQLIGMIDADGIYPMPAIIKQDGDLEYLMYAVEQHEMLKNIRLRCLMSVVDEFYFGIDSYCRYNQGTTLDSCVVIFNGTRDQCRLGIFEYSYNGGSPIHKPVNWNNQFWNDRYQNLIIDVKNSMKTGGV